MWLEESMKKGKRMKDHHKVGDIDIYIKDQLPEDIDASFVFDYISSRVPFYLLGGIEVIYVGSFPEMKKRDIEAFYEDEAIYITNEQESEMEMVESLIHEISHALEQRQMETIYDDGNLESEFLAKRRRIAQLLSQKYMLPEGFETDHSYRRDIDIFLYETVGYEALGQICVNIFPSAYSVTSISEYWAKGFEELFLGDRTVFKELCPILYNKMINVTEILKE